MARRTKRRVKKRFFYILTFIIAVFLCIFITRNLILNSIFNKGIPALNQTEVTSNDDEDKYIVCIDAGHGGFDSGTISPSGVMEKDINLKLALKLGKILEKSDLKIIYTRTSDDVMGSFQKEDLQLRCDFSNNAKADIFVSLHCNFDKLSPDTNGTEIWCRFPNEKGGRLAENIRKYLSDTGYTRDRGIKYESDGGLFVLKNTDAVAVLIETGFLSNSKDCNFLSSEKGQDKCAKAIAQAILDYISGK